jgi:tRNA uridine 5-carboxymethylaminomethyl modification enzyme
MTGKIYDIAVVGGGHAGVEAALAGARSGCSVVLLTHAADEIGRMPCNPAIGGLGKGQLVREIDALGGEMGRAIDKTGIQFRVLNRRKGPAVQSPRAQADKHAYQQEIQNSVQSQDGLELIEGDVVDLAVEDRGERRVTTGVRLGDGRRIKAHKIILCTGTFMGGLMHVGEEKIQGGREGATASLSLSPALEKLGIEMLRLKTGTPARLFAESLDYAKLQVQVGDEDPTPFSFRTGEFKPSQIDCYVTYTNESTHEIIRNGLHLSPLYGGIIQGQGPRYCPSIEDKVVRFADKQQHQIFLEPEGRTSDEIYINGLSTSLPAGLQEEFIHSVEGLESARISRFGYAVEYDSVPPWQINYDLETKKISGLYLAGQIIGTSGYEEAAALGLVAGLNAVRALDGQPGLRISRDSAYIGVMIDDLVTKEITEPYRMFTSRAEHRLYLRCDNAESRMQDLAAEVGLLSVQDLDLLNRRAGAVIEIDSLLKIAKGPAADGGTLPAIEVMKRPEMDLQDFYSLRLGDQTMADTLADLPQRASLPPRLKKEADREAIVGLKYSGYIHKQDKKLKEQKYLDNLELPDDLDYMSINALSYESREKLSRIRPANIGRASRIDGVRPADLAILSIIVKRR